jgi:peptide/nickel transport system substrate-binding protein
MRRRIFLAATAASALAGPAAGQPQRGSVLRFVPETDLPTPDPHLSASRATRDHAFMVFDTLFGRDADNRPALQMVEGYTISQDGLQWRLQLRGGLYFHTLDRVEPADCIASIRRWAARDAAGQALLAATQDISAADARTIVFRLKAPFPHLHALLGRTTGPICAIMPARLAATPPDRPIPEVIGSGPFRWSAAEREVGKRAVYLRHEPYIPKRGITARTAGPKEVFIERVEWQMMDDAAAGAALLRGAVDWWGSVAPAELGALRRSADVKLPVIAPDGLIAWLRPNHLHPPFDKAEVRRALLAAISQHDCMVALNGDDGPEWREGIGFFAPASKVPADMPAPLARPAARQAMQAAGAAGQAVRLLVPAGRFAPLGEAVAGLLREIGLDVAVQSLSPAAMAEAMARTDPVAAGGWSLALGDSEAAAMADPLDHALLRGNGRAAAPGWPSSPRLETMRAAWIAAPDEGWRRRIAAAMQARAMEDVPYVPLGLSIPPSGVRAGLTGLQVGLPLFWSVRRK